MVLLTLIALAQLVVMILLLGVVLEQVTRQEIERATAEQRVQRQTTDALLEAAAVSSVDGQGSAVTRRRSR